MNIYKYDVRPFSSYDNWTWRSDTKNISNILDRMIRITAKLTECFASDIIYEIRALMKAVKEDEPLDFVLAFREGGVSRHSITEGKVEYPCVINAIQVYRLTYYPNSTLTVLQRVNLADAAHNSYVGG